jgi:hypothetical protein
MKVKEIVDVTDCVYIIVVKDGDRFNSESTIPDDVLAAEVKSIQLGVDGMIINIEKPTKSETLEDLGYSFEVGV